MGNQASTRGGGTRYNYDDKYQRKKPSATYSRHSGSEMGYFSSCQRTNNSCLIGRERLTQVREENVLRLRYILICNLYKKQHQFERLNMQLFTHMTMTNKTFRFSKVPKSFRTRKAIAKYRSLRLQSRFIHVLLT